LTVKKTPVELDVRRNLVREIASLLETRCLKATKLQLVSPSAGSVLDSPFGGKS